MGWGLLQELRVAACVVQQVGWGLLQELRVAVCVVQQVGWGLLEEVCYIWCIDMITDKHCLNWLRALSTAHVILQITVAISGGVWSAESGC